MNDFRSFNNNSALLHSDFVSQAIEDLLNSDCVDICLNQPFIVNPLSVSVQNSGKKRLILDLSFVNKFLFKQSVKYEDIRTALTFLKKGGFMYQFDLKSGYHHVPICVHHQQYLGFTWFYKGALTYFTFKVLPFGLSSAPYIFTKVVRPLVKKWRSQGINIVVYLDDGLGYAESLAEAKYHSHVVKSDLINAGFVPNVQKSIWEPVSKTEWLGFQLNLENGMMSLPSRRITSITQGIHSILSHDDSSDQEKVVHVRDLASVAGKIISSYLIIGSVSRLMTKSIHCVIETRRSWNSYVILSSEAIQELQFWQENIESLNSTPIKFVSKCSRIVYSDASSSGFAGYEVDSEFGISHGQWADEEKKRVQLGVIKSSRDSFGISST